MKVADKYGGLGDLVVSPRAALANCLRFDSLVARHIQRLISRAFTYGAVCSLALSWPWTNNVGSFPSVASGFNCVNLGQRLCTYNVPYLTKLSILSSSVNRYRL